MTIHLFLSLSHSLTSPTLSQYLIDSQQALEAIHETKWGGIAPGMQSASIYGGPTMNSSTMNIKLGQKSRW